jgi:hypothetical protein
MFLWVTDEAGRSERRFLMPMTPGFNARSVNANSLQSSQTFWKGD